MAVPAQRNWFWWGHCAQDCSVRRQPHVWKGSFFCIPLLSLQLADLFWPLLLSFYKGPYALASQLTLTWERNIRYIRLKQQHLFYIICLVFLTHENWDIILNLYLRRLSQHFSRGFRSVNVEHALIQPWQVNLASFASSRLLLYLKYGPFWPRRHFTWIWDGFRISDVTIVSLLIWGFKKVTTDVCIVQMSSRLF